MRLIYRVLLSIVVIIAALLCYSAGNMTGVTMFIVLGFMLEFALWFGLGKIFRRRAS
ncbi:hypothetical protein [Paraglaciecola sp. 20A4]|uniref:hypothetical protein n=1 Tax=Paraglaciecola sp. 20A4 TaxID=2687288 RepID=UPI00140B1D13|nr:hypothetical protein [Paraglaciecola sp. 20A4]